MSTTILLEKENRTVVHILEESYARHKGKGKNAEQGSKNSKKENTENHSKEADKSENERLYVVCDFDECKYVLLEKSNRLVVGVQIPYWEDIEKYDLMKYFREDYKEFVDDIPLVHEVKGNGGEERSMVYKCNASISVDVENENSVKEFIKKASMMMTDLKSYVLRYAFDKMRTSGQGAFKPIRVSNRRNTGEAMIIVQAGESVAVYFAICFKDKNDKQLSEVFLKELLSAKTKVRGAPTVEFYKELPSAIEGVFDAKAIKGSSKGKGAAEYYYVSILLPVEKPSGKSPGDPSLESKAMDRFIERARNVPTFRNYIHYHIKCAKAHLHEKMRGWYRELSGSIESACRKTEEG